MAFPTGWSYKRKVEIDTGQKSGSPTGIVLTITEASGLADANGPLDADGTAPAQNGGGDLRVSSDAAGTNQIPLDVVSFVTDNDHASATCELKVNFDDLSSDALYLWWGTAGTESQPAVTDTYGRNAVYSSGSHAAVYALHEDPSGSAPQVIDRTGSGFDGTSAGSMTSGDVVSGIVGDALDFDGTDDRIGLGSPAMGLSTGDLTMRVSVKTSTSQRGAPLVQRQPDGNIAVCGWYIANGTTLASNGTKPVFMYRASNTYDYRTPCSSHNTDGAWHTYTAVVDQTANTVTLYVDGSDDTGTPTGSFPPSISIESQPMSIGRAGDFASAWFFNGQIDNVSIYTRAMSGSDDATLYNCESNNAAFWSIGSVQSAGGGTTINAAAASLAITGVAASVSPTTLVIASTGQGTASPLSASVSVGTTIGASVGQVSFAPNAASVAVGTEISATSGSLHLTSLKASVSVGTVISATVASVNASGLAADVSPVTHVAATLATAQAAGLAAAVSAAVNVSAGTATASLAGFAASVSTGVSFTASAATATVSGLAATVTAGTQINAATAAVAIVPQPATVTAGVSITATTATSQASGLAATVIPTQAVSAATASIQLAGLAATISAGASITAATATLTCTSLAVSVSSGTSITAAAAAAQLSGSVATVSATVSVQASTAIVRLAPQAATITLGGRIRRPHLFTGGRMSNDWGFRTGGAL